MQTIRNMPVIKIWFEDFWDGFDKYNNWFTVILRKHFQLEFDKGNPDFIFCSVFGQKALDYKGVRIIYVGENYVADFNKYDYVLGFDHIQFGDRYLRMSMKNIREDWEDIINKHKHVDMEKFMKRDFCCRVVSNGDCTFREFVYERLSSVRQVASGGSYRNNLPQRSAVVNKKQFLEGYKFNLAFENSSYPGYCTEKIYDAWAAGCIPIYWGDPTIENWCNEDAFINCNKFRSADEIIDFVLGLEKDASRMEKMLRTPILKHEKNDEDELEKFLLNIFSCTRKEAYRRNSIFSLYIQKKENYTKKEKNLTMTTTQVYNILDGLIREEIDRGQTIGIYPFGKNGLIAKAILVERYGGADRILLDNDLAQYNREIISIEEFEKLDNSNITIILCTTNPLLNETLMKDLKQRKLKAHIRNVLDSGP